MLALKIESGFFTFNLNPNPYSLRNIRQVSVATSPWNINCRWVLCPHRQYPAELQYSESAWGL